MVLTLELGAQGYKLFSVSAVEESVNIAVHRDADLLCDGKVERGCDKGCDKSACRGNIGKAGEADV